LCNEGKESENGNKRERKRKRKKEHREIKSVVMQIGKFFFE